MTDKEALDKKLLRWNPELVFTEVGGYKLVLNIDAFNEHMFWDVLWVDEFDGLERIREFDSFSEARDYFLEQINKEAK